MSFENKVVWLTGASSGIGKALAQQLAAGGARIILSSRRRSELELVCQQLAGGSDRHWVVPLDLAQPERVLATAEEFIKQIGRIDYVINNGGISQRATCIDSSFDVYRQLIEINYLGTIALTKAALPMMKQQGHGHIVAISSVAGKVGTKLRSGYSGSKYAVNGFMDCLRAELKADGIRCLTVCPGSIKTNIAFNALNGSGRAQQHNDPSIEKGMHVHLCAKKIIQAINRGKDEVVIGQGSSAWAPLIKRFFPSLMNHIVARIEYR